MKYIVANWKGKVKAEDERLYIEYWKKFARNIGLKERMKVIICLGHNGEIGNEIGEKI